MRMVRLPMLRSTKSLTREPAGARRVVEPERAVPGAAGGGYIPVRAGGGQERPGPRGSGPARITKLPAASNIPARGVTRHRERMSRRKRPYEPGCVFHITARTIRHAKWFKDDRLRDHVTHCLRDCLPRSDAQLLAYAVMPNHFHLIVRQGTAPLSRLMQPLCQAIALRVHRAFGHEGYVFERRFRDKACMSARHLRNAIVYTHQNPVDGKLCEQEQEFRWSSYCDYFPEFQRPEGACSRPQVFVPLRLFAVRETDSWDDLKRSYADYAAWALERRRYRKENKKPTTPPLMTAGDEYWLKNFVRRDPRTLENAAAWRPDLRDLAKSIVHEMAPGFTIAQLRMTRGGPAATMIRRAIIERALRLGFRAADIARYLHISHTIVSRRATELNGRPVLVEQKPADNPPENT